jgi:hypothetical protein
MREPEHIGDDDSGNSTQVDPGLIEQGHRDYIETTRIQ